MAAKRKITIHPSTGGKKVIPNSVEKKTAPVEKVEAPKVVEEAVKEFDPKAARTKRGCYFCQSKAKPTYTDLVTLRKFLTERAKIVPKLKSSLCSRHQRGVSKEIKYARHLSLLPFVPTV